MPRRVGGDGTVTVPRGQVPERPRPAAPAATPTTPSAGWAARGTPTRAVQAALSQGTWPTSADGTPIFKQGDPEWGARKLGSAGATIASAGCAMTSSAMAMSKLTGRPVSPKELDAWLDTHRGYSGDSLDWSRVGKARGLEVEQAYFRLTTIDQQLDAGRPVVMGVDYKPGSAGGGNGTDHWVCLTARETGPDGKPRYLANDPGTGKVIRFSVGPKGTLVCDGADALGKYRSTGELRIFKGDGAADAS